MNQELAAELIKLLWVLSLDIINIVKTWGVRNGISPDEFDKIVDDCKKSFSQKLAAHAVEERAIFDPQVSASNVSLP